MRRTAGRRRAGEADHQSDEALLEAVRGGDVTAFEVLYHRHHAAARRLAATLVGDPHDADDLVAEAVARVLGALRCGAGPRVAFRAYLLTAVRHACFDRSRQLRRLDLTADFSRYESSQLAPGDSTLARLDRAYVARAFAKLPPRWQVVLWHTVVRGERPATLAPVLGLSPNAVAALAYRARERLRQMYLQEHLTGAPNPGCQWLASRLAAHVRGTLPPRELERADAHLAACRPCRALRAEIVEINATLRPAVRYPTQAGPPAEETATTSKPGNMAMSAPRPR